MLRLPFIVALLAYAYVTLAHLLPGLLGDKALARARAIGAVGAAVHLVTLVTGALVGGHPPGLPDALMATSFGVAAAYAWIGVGRLRSLGMLLGPLALVLLGTGLVVPHHTVEALDDTGFSPWLPVHLFLVFAGIAGFALAGAVGAVYLWARHQLKQKKFAGMSRLPSLEVLDRIQFRSMLFGFVFLTLGIGAGGAWAAASLTEPWTVDPKIWTTLLIWVWYGIALQLRLVAGRRGRWTALFSIIGFCGLVFSLVGVNYLLSGWHGYGV